MIASCIPRRLAPSPAPWAELGREATPVAPLDEAWVRRWLVRQCAGADPVLDIGCGSGDLAAALARRGHRVTGIDQDGAQLAQARQRHAALEVQWLRDDAERLAHLPRATFAAATLVFVLHHLRRPPSGLAAAWRALAPGGRLLVAEMLPKGPNANDACHQIQLKQWLAWLGALRPAGMRLTAPPSQEWVLARLSKRA